MKKFGLLMVILLVTILGACGNDEENTQNQEVPEFLEVEINLPEENLEVGAVINLEAYVSQGGEAVEDADEVKFEVLKQDDTESEMLEGEHSGEGIYKAKKTFATEGVYSVTAHVTARDMHNMPKKELIVGNPTSAVPSTEDQETDSHEESHDADADTEDSEAHGHGHGHEGDVVVDLQSGFDMVVNENTKLSVLIKQKGNPLTGAKISFEIWREGQEKHEFLDAAEDGNGIYHATKTFETTGTHLINVHVNTDSLHEHQLFSVTVN
jgi:YtkA-like